MHYLNIAGYYFYKNTRLVSLQKKLREECLRLGLRGTVLLAKEGINVFLAGEEKNIREIQKFLRNAAQNPDFEFKESRSETLPFQRLRIKIKSQIIAFNARGVNPQKHRSPAISPETLKQWLDENRDFTLLDTRNHYEVLLGTFKKAEHLKIRNFKLYKNSAKKLPETIKEKPLVVFCTGGIRCEKAAPLMEKIGFRNVYQLDGGILNYFKKTGGAHFRGDCFVFDDRVALDSNLEECENFPCPNCGHAVTRQERRQKEFRFGKNCPKCFKSGAFKETAQSDHPPQ